MLLFACMIYVLCGFIICAAASYCNSGYTAAFILYWFSRPYVNRVEYLGFRIAPREVGCKANKCPPNCL